MARDFLFSFLNSINFFFAFETRLGTKVKICCFKKSYEISSSLNLIASSHLNPLAHHKRDRIKIFREGEAS